jgi:hypothetical protein
LPELPRSEQGDTRCEVTSVTKQKKMLQVTGWGLRTDGPTDGRTYGQRDVSVEILFQMLSSGKSFAVYSVSAIVFLTISESVQSLKIDNVDFYLKGPNFLQKL